MCERLYLLKVYISRQSQWVIVPDEERLYCSGRSSASETETGKSKSSAPRGCSQTGCDRTRHSAQLSLSVLGKVVGEARTQLQMAVARKWLPVETDQKFGDKNGHWGGIPSTLYLPLESVSPSGNRILLVQKIA